MAVRCAILDDYQNVALKSADWSKVEGDVEIKVFSEHLGAGQSVIAALKEFAIVVAMRERTAFPRDGDRRAPQSEAPDHHRHAQRLDRHRGGESARRHRLWHRLVRQPDLRHSHWSDARTHPPHRLRERPPARRRHLAEHHRPRPRRHDARHPRTGQTRRPHRRHRQGVRHEGDRLEPEPHGRSAARRSASATSARTTCFASRTSSPSTTCCRRARAAWSAQRNLA